MKIDNFKLPNIDRLRSVQNVVTRVVAVSPWTISSTNSRRDLHWLPVNHRVTYKLCLITCKTLIQPNLSEI